MTHKIELSRSHPEGELKSEAKTKNDLATIQGPLTVDTLGGRVQVEWDTQAPSTPLGQLVFFAQFLKASEIFSRYCEDAPLHYQSNNAPSATDILGTVLLSILCGHHRYAHMSALRFDTVNPPLFGMSRVVSEDSVRRAFEGMDEQEAQKWQQKHFRLCWEPLLGEPWVLDIDSTVKTIYGRQQGAEVGYNRYRPGRPSHVYHSYFIGRIRVCLDVEVTPGKQTAGKYGMPGLWRLIDSLPRKAWPQFLRGDCGYGNQENMQEAESRDVHYLFKLRQTPKAKTLIRALEQQGRWTEAGKGWEGIESTLQLMGWNRKRRVIILRRKQTYRERWKSVKNNKLPLLEWGGLFPLASEIYEYAILVTSLDYLIETIAQLYRDRADVENCYDELKNQWGWGGYTTADLKRCQLLARMVGLVYNWWSLFVRLADPHRYREAITSRPMLLHGVAQQTQHAGQTKLTVSSLHAEAGKIREMLRNLSRFLSDLTQGAEQLNVVERWRRILSKAFEKLLGGRLLQPLSWALESG